jgi:hypothetical protein
MENLIEENRDNLEKAYHTLYDLSMMDMIHGKETDAVKAYRALETALVGLGILECDEEQEDEEEKESDYTNDEQHWGEYVADLKYDMYRDLSLEGYEY